MDSMTGAYHYLHCRVCASFQSDYKGITLHEILLDMKNLERQERRITCRCLFCGRRKRFTISEAEYWTLFYPHLQRREYET